MRIHLPMQGTYVRLLVWEDSTCHGAAKAHVPQLLSLYSRAHRPQLLSHTRQLLKPMHLEPVLLRNKRCHCNEKLMHSKEEQSLLTATREGPRAVTKTKCNQRNNFFLKNN